MSASTTSAPEPGSADSEHSLTDELQDAYGDELAAIGLEVSRAGLALDAANPGYVEDGAHLAIYVTPRRDADRSPEAYANRIVPLAHLFVERVFREWPGIESFDVCQEPEQREEITEPPLTVMLVRRDQAEAQQWADIDLAELRRRAAARPKLASLVVTEPVAATDIWRAAAP